MARQIKVDPTKRRGHRTLGSALAAASPGDEILVAPGTYAEPLVLTRPVRLTAEPGTVTLQAHGAFVVHLHPLAAGSSFTGLRFRALDTHVAVKVEAPACSFRECALEGAKVEGIWVTGAGQIDLERCLIASAMSQGMAVRDGWAALRSCDLAAPRGIGIEAIGGQLSLDGCRFAGTASNALYLKRISATVRRCTFRDARTEYPSIYVGDGGDATIEGCEFDRLRAPAIVYEGRARGSVQTCTLRTLSGNGLAILDGAIVAVRDLTAVDVEKIVMRVDRGGQMDLAGATVSGRTECALLVGAGVQVDAADLDAKGCSGSTVAVAGSQARLNLARATIRDGSGNALKVTDGGMCRATDLLVEYGEVDFPLVIILAGSSASITTSTMRGGAEAAVAHAGDGVELMDVTFEGTGRHAVMAAGARASLERCTVADSGAGIEAADGCRLSITETEVDGGDSGFVCGSEAIVRVTDCTVRGSRRSGIRVEGAKLVLTSTRVTDSRGDGIVVGDDSEVDLRGVEISASAGVGLRSTTALTLDEGALELHGNANGDLEWPGMSARDAGRSVDDLIAELDLLVGLEDVKQKVRSLLNVIRLRQREAELGRRSEPISLHAVFTGPPGTGKTTVARLYGEILRAMGFLDGGGFSEVTRADLVVGYIGQTATNVRTKFTEAMGGVLFIDEAYALAQEGGSYKDFGVEAINELVPLMENHRTEIAVIAAGYTDEMDAFLSRNPGLRGRFAAVIEFPDYSDDELMEIFRRSLFRQERTATPDALAVAAAHFAGLPRNASFANAREVRRLIDGVVEAIANRVADMEDLYMENPTEDALSTVVEADVRVAAAGLSG